MYVPYQLGESVGGVILRCSIALIWRVLVEAFTDHEVKRGSIFLGKGWVWVAAVQFVISGYVFDHIEHVWMKISWGEVIL